MVSIQVLLLHILQKATLINKYGEWTGGNTILVQVGDLLDEPVQTPYGIHVITRTG